MWGDYEIRSEPGNSDRPYTVGFTDTYTQSWHPVWRCSSRSEAEECICSLERKAKRKETFKAVLNVAVGITVVIILRILVPEWFM
jgi:hypothetical protein